MHGPTRAKNLRTDLKQRRMGEAIAQVNESRNRSTMIRGGKKAVVKKTPIDGQQGMVSIQEQYQFPLRSRLLKKLTTATQQSQPPLNQSTLKEYFSKSTTDKDKVVMDWMSEVEKHPRPEIIILPSPTPSGNKIQFKSEAGKRWANRIQNTSLQAPSDSCQKHYIPRRLLTNKKIPVTETAACIERIWKENHPQHHLETKVGMTVMANTGERTPMAGMVQLVHTLHESLKLQEQRSTARIEKLEILLAKEKSRHEAAEASLKKLEQPKRKPPVRRPFGK